jgi:hypothetical protein
MWGNVFYYGKAYLQRTLQINVLFERSFKFVELWESILIANSVMMTINKNSDKIK